MALEYEAGNPRITKDGVTVAKNVMMVYNSKNGKLIYVNRKTDFLKWVQVC